MSDIKSDPDLLGLTAEIVAAHVSNNAVALPDLASLIRDVYRTLSTIGAPPAPPVAEMAQPAVPIKKSITPEYLICLEDGRRLKTLKRHLKASFGLTPDQYREKWGLPRDYPMVAPLYAAKRSELAKNLGLGTRPTAEPAPASARGRKAAAKKG